jgi:hypothetical protein
VGTWIAEVRFKKKLKHKFFLSFGGFTPAAVASTEGDNPCKNYRASFPIYAGCAAGPIMFLPSLESCMLFLCHIRENCKKKIRVFITYPKSVTPMQYPLKTYGYLQNGLRLLAARTFPPFL